MLPTDRLTILLTMACLSSSNRVCARVVQEKLCQIVVGKNYHHQQQPQQQQHLAVTSAAGGVAGTGSGSSGGAGQVTAAAAVGSAAVGNHAKRTVFSSGGVGGGPLFTTLKSGMLAFDGSVEVLKYGPSVGMFGGSINGGGVRNFYSSSLVRNLFKKNQVRSGADPRDALKVTDGTVEGSAVTGFRRNLSPSAIRTISKCSSRKSSPGFGRCIKSLGTIFDATVVASVAFEFSGVGYLAHLPSS